MFSRTARFTANFASRTRSAYSGARARARAAPWSAKAAGVAVAGIALFGLGAPAAMRHADLSQIEARLHKMEAMMSKVAHQLHLDEFPPGSDFPYFAPENRSLLKQLLTPEIYEELKDASTPSGFTFARAIQSGVDNQDSGVGVYAGDEASYEVFGPLMDRVIQTYHNHGPVDKHVSDMDSAKLSGNPDPTGKYVVSTRIRVGRNIRGLGLAPGIRRCERRKVEELVVSSLGDLGGDLKGRYYSLMSMTEKERQQLVDDHFLFKKGDRFLESAGANRDWPESRGIFHNDEKTFLVWVNEEDQMRIISMQKGADAKQVFERLARAIQSVEDGIKAKGYEFMYNDHLGYIHSCPTNCGTGMRASVHVKLPLLQEHPRFGEICGKLRLQARGTAGEHTKSKGGVVDISNKERLGKSEVALVQTMIDGVTKLIQLEQMLEKGKDIASAF